MRGDALWGSLPGMCASASWRLVRHISRDRVKELRSTRVKVWMHVASCARKNGHAFCNGKRIVLLFSSCGESFAHHLSSMRDFVSRLCVWGVNIVHCGLWSWILLICVYLLFCWTGESFGHLHLAPKSAAIFIVFLVAKRVVKNGVYEKLEKRQPSFPMLFPMLNAWPVTMEKIYAREGCQQQSGGLILIDKMFIEQWNKQPQTWVLFWFRPACHWSDDKVYCFTAGELDEYASRTRRELLSCMNKPKVV